MCLLVVFIPRTPEIAQTREHATFECGADAAISASAHLLLCCRTPLVTCMHFSLQLPVQIAPWPCSLAITVPCSAVHGWRSVSESVLAAEPYANMMDAMLSCRFISYIRNAGRHRKFGH